MRAFGLFAIALALAPAFACAQNADSVALLRLEAEWNRAHVQADTAALNRLWAPTLTVAVPEMPPMSKDDLLRFWRSGRSNIVRYDTEDVAIQLSGDLAVATGRLRRERNFNGQLVADDWRFTKVYARHDGVWRVIAYHASVAAKPRPF